MTTFRRGRYLWDFRLGACRIYFGPARQVPPEPPFPSRTWPFFRVEVE